jgi:hypothetical protein
VWPVVLATALIDVGPFADLYTSRPGVTASLAKGHLAVLLD